MKKPSNLILIFLAASLLAGLAGYWYHSMQVDRVKREVSATLRAVAELKAAEITRWRQGLINSARVVATELAQEIDPGSGALLTDTGANPRLSMRLKSYAENFQLDDILLLSPRGGFLYNISNVPEKIETADRAALAEAVRTEGAAVSELFSHSTCDGEKHLDVIAPVKLPGGPVRAFVLLRVSPERFLYPMIQSWPVPSATGETLLVRREGNRALYLNDLRHRSGAALNLSLDLTQTNLPAARAILGTYGYFEGEDYRGVAVHSYIMPVPATGWFIISKIDDSEAFAELTQVNVISAALAAVLLIAAFLATRILFSTVERDSLTAQLALERSRREAEERYRVTIMCMGDGVILTDEKGLVQLLNPLAEALTGWRTDEARGRELTEVFEIVNMDTRKPVVNPVAEVLARNVVVGLANHTLLISREGVERPIADSAAPVRDEAGEVTGVVLLFRDQTEEYFARGEVEKSGRRYRELFKGIMEGFALHEVLLDERGKPIDYRFIEVNPAFERLTGLKNSEVAGRRIREIMPDIEEVWIDAYGKVAMGGEEMQFKEYNKHLEKHFEVHAYSPATGQFACLFRDVTAEVNARRALESRLLALTSPLVGVDGLKFTDLFDTRMLQEIQDAFAEATGVASVIVDMEGNPLTSPSKFTRFCRNVVRSTERGAAKCRISAIEMGRPCDTPPNLRPCLSAGLWDAGAPIMVGDRQVANWLIGQVREPVIDEARARAYAAEIGVPFEYYLEALKEVPVVDHERFRSVALALHQLALQLSTLACQNVQQARLLSERERTEKEKAHLSERLHQSQKLESVGRLAGGVAHDFNNMLSVIMGNCELATASLPETSPAREYLSEIRTAADRSAQITRQLLTFARKQAVAPRVIDLTETVGQALKLLTRLIGEEVRVVWRPSRDLWRVRIDPVQVEQVLANLATNARDAIKGVGTLTIEASDVEVDEREALLHPDVSPGQYVRLTVSDTGRGMSGSLLAHIFEPFFTTKGVGEGTGLGLATVYGIARQNGGFVTAESVEGVGSSFHVYFPRFDEPVEAHGEPVQESAPHGSELVLVVEDEPAILNLARRILLSHGYRVLSANSTEDALAHSTENPSGIDLLVTDVIMPTMNGRDLAIEVRALQPDIRVLFMSGYTSEVIAHHGVLDPGVNFLPKPFSVADLALKVRETLDAN